MRKSDLRPGLLPDKDSILSTLLEGSDIGMIEPPPCKYCHKRLLCSSKKYFVCLGCRRFGLINAVTATESEVKQIQGAEGALCVLNEDDIVKFLRTAYSIRGKDTQEVVTKTASSLMEIHSFLSFDEKKVYWYFDGWYRGDGRIRIEQDAQAILREKATNKIISEIIGHIRRSVISNEQTELGKTEELLCLENGLYNINTYEFFPHNKEFYFNAKMPIVYDPTAKCPEIETYVKDIFQEKDYELIQELMGYLLSVDYDFHHLFILVGEGRNGKGTLIRLIGRFLGDDACCAVSLQQLSNNRFMAASLFGKKANLFGDLSAADLSDDSLIKMVTGQDAITSDRKYQEPIKFTNKAKFVISCNRLPKSKDDSQGWWGRLIIIDCIKSLIGREDRDLERRMHTTEEISGLFNWAIEGLKRLRKNNGFSYSKTIEEIRFRYNRDSDPVASFIYECVEREPMAITPKEDLYFSFMSYCYENGFQSKNNALFHKELKRYFSGYELFKEVHPTMERNGVRKQVRCIQGIRLNDQAPTTMQEIHV